MKLLKKIFKIKSKAEKEQLQREFEEMKLGLKEKVSGLTQPAVKLSYSNSRTSSKFGGNPIVNDSDFSWPTFSGKPLIFLGQLDLIDVSKKHKYDWLAESGSLLFFYDFEAWGFDPKDRGRWRVIYQELPKIEVAFPEGFKKEFDVKESFLKPSEIEVLPHYDDVSIEKLGLTDEETDLYIEIKEHFKEFDAHGDLSYHQVGGAPYPIQGNVMQFEAEKASNGFYMGDGKEYEKAKQKDYLLAKDKWELLFQVDSDDDLGMYWGDLGMIYFWVEKEKSKVNNFNDSWLVLQCT